MLLAASKAYYSMVEKHGRIAQRAFAKAFPGVDSAMWPRYYAVGAGLCVPETLYLSDKTARLVERVPLEEQKEMLSGVNSVTVVTPRGRVVRKPLVRLTQKEEGILFRPDGRIRSVEEMEAARESAVAVQPPDYEVRGRSLIVRRPFTFGKATLEQILESMP